MIVPAPPGVGGHSGHRLGALRPYPGASSRSCTRRPRDIRRRLHGRDRVVGQSAVQAHGQPGGGQTSRRKLTSTGVGFPRVGERAHPIIARLVEADAARAQEELAGAWRSWSNAPRFSDPATPSWSMHSSSHWSGRAQVLQCGTGRRPSSRRALARRLSCSPCGPGTAGQRETGRPCRLG